MIINNVRAIMKLFAFTGFLCCTLVGFPQETADYLLRAKALIDRGKSREAIALLSDALSGVKDNRLYLLRAEAFLAAASYSEAISDFQSANQMDPSSGEYGLSRIYAIKGDAKTSLYHLEQNIGSSYRKSEKAVMLDPAFSNIENTADWRQFWKKERYSFSERKISEIEYYISTSDRAEAAGILSELSKEYPAYNSTLYATALVDISMQKYPEAIATLAKLIADDKLNESYLRLLGKAQLAAGNYAGASVTFTILFDLGLTDAYLLISRAESFRKTGETDKALRDLSRFLDLYPENMEAIRLAGKIEAESGDNLKALEYFSKNLKLYPNDPECYIDRANSLFISKSWEPAISDYSMALDIQPGNSDAWLNKGVALLSIGKTDDGCHDFRKALSLGNKKATPYISRYCIK